MLLILAFSWKPFIITSTPSLLYSTFALLALLSVDSSFAIAKCQVKSINPKKRTNSLETLWKNALWNGIIQIAYVTDQESPLVL